MTTRAPEWDDQGAPIGLEDIAKKLGISISTVSRALRDSPGIHPATRAKVLKAVKTMGYVAPGKKQDEQASDPEQTLEDPKNILVLTFGGRGASAGYFAGMSQAALPLHFSILSHFSPEGAGLDILEKNHQPPALRMGLIDGIVFVFRWPDEVVRTFSQKWPTVSIVEGYPKVPINVIGVDHSGGMLSLVEHLHQGGHQRIGFFGLRSDVSWVRSRYAAYVEALLAFNLPCHFEDAISLREMRSIFDPEFLPNEEAIEKVVEKIRQGVRAWVCSSDVTGNALCAALVQRGLRIPEDVAIAGFHRRPGLAPHQPPLTTTEVRDDLVGAAAMRRLAYLLKHPDDEPRFITLPCKFFQGETTNSPLLEKM